MRIQSHLTAELTRSLMNKTNRRVVLPAAIIFLLLPIIVIFLFFVTDTPELAALLLPLAGLGLGFGGFFLLSLRDSKRLVEMHLEKEYNGAVEREEIYDLTPNGLIDYSDGYTTEIPWNTVTEITVHGRALVVRTKFYIRCIGVEESMIPQIRAYILGCAPFLAPKFKVK